MRAIAIIFLVLVGIYFAPALLAAFFGVVISLGVLLMIAGLAYLITFMIAGSILTAAVVALAIVAVATMGAWLPIVLVVLFVFWLIKRTNMARN
ncbi:MAG TPA: hypothetical protein VKY35_02930 [Aliidiomarina sp.]|nr:hypothetical protein [Aliidiomarina sp.]